jgi:DNA ligase (NAD+)
VRLGCRTNRVAAAESPSYPSTVMTSSHLGGGLELSAEERERVVELASRLENYKQKYYDGTPEISDEAYDALEDELRQLAPAHPVLAKVGSPVAADAWGKARHEIPMGSLNKVTNAEELRAWAARCDELLAKEEGEVPKSIVDDLYVAEKLDGISIELIYRDGRFVDGITRGDGEVGERITSNVERMRGVPRRIRHEGRLSVRGEIILRLTDMGSHFTDYTSPRNAAAGTARRLDGGGNEFLTVLCYDMAEELDLATEVDKFALLREWGFATPNTYRGSLDEIIAVYDSYSSSKRDELDYEIDGLVVRSNSLAQQGLLGDLNRRPRGAVAFKFESPRKVSRVREVRWDTGPSGRVTPVAIVEPVMLAGAKIQRASLHNVTNVKRLGIGVGDEVIVSRRNDVIPYIEEVIEHVGAAAQVPETCGVCEHAVALEGEYLMCRNGECPALIEGRIHNWIDAVGALEWGDKLVATVVDKGLVREPLHLYQLEVKDIASLERHGTKSAENALSQLRSRLPLKLETFLAALGIEGFSTQTARLVVQAGFDHIDKVLAATEEELAAVKGLGELKARGIVAGLAARSEEIARLRAGGIEPVSVDDAGPLGAKSFCITGSHSRGRKELVQVIEDAGGRVLNGVTKELDYLVIANPASTSSKATKARRYGTELIDEDTLMGLIEGD